MLSLFTHEVLESPDIQLMSHQAVPFDYADVHYAGHGRGFHKAVRKIKRQNTMFLHRKIDQLDEVPGYLAVFASTADRLTRDGFEEVEQVLAWDFEAAGQVVVDAARKIARKRFSEDVAVLEIGMANPQVDRSGNLQVRARGEDVRIIGKYSVDEFYRHYSTAREALGRLAITEPGNEYLHDIGVLHPADY